MASDSKVALVCELMTYYGCETRTEIYNNVLGECK